jgi:hypothetical protein
MEIWFKLQRQLTRLQRHLRVQLQPQSLPLLQLQPITLHGLLPSQLPVIGPHGRLPSQLPVVGWSTWSAAQPATCHWSTWSAAQPATCHWHGPHGLLHSQLSTCVDIAPSPQRFALACTPYDLCARSTHCSEVLTPGHIARINVDRIRAHREVTFRNTAAAVASISLS